MVQKSKCHQLRFGIELSLGLSPLPVTVTTRTMTFFSRGSQPKPSFATGIVGGGTTQIVPLLVGSK